MRDWPAEERAALTLFVCVAALTGLRLAASAFSATNLFFDEAQYWFWSRELALGYYSKPPLIAWIIRASTDVCGMSEACIRAPSALIHGATALVVYAIGRRLYDAHTGAWAGLAYVTMPGVSFSAALISTDVPLLFFVALALLALVHLRERVTWGWVAVLGASIGLGLLAKYAMSYFFAGLLIYGLATGEGRALFRNPRLYAAFAIAAAIVAPNIVWNAQHKFATLGHTADNAAWGGGVRPGAALAFLGEQFAVFGPVLFGALLVYAVSVAVSPQVRAAAGGRERLLLAFSVPVLVLMTAQAFLSRAHANWGAFAYIAGTVLVTAFLLQGRRMVLLRLSLGLHLVIATAIPAGGVLAGRVAVPFVDRAYSRVLGWPDIAAAAAAEARKGGFRAIAADGRPLAAELSYYLRDSGLLVVALTDGGAPRDHFEMTRPLKPDTPRPILVVSFSGQGPAGAVRTGSVATTGGQKHRYVYFYAMKESAE